MAANNNLHPHPLVRKLDSICILTQNEREHSSVSQASALGRGGR